MFYARELHLNHEVRRGGWRQVSLGHLAFLDTREKFMHAGVFVIGFHQQKSKTKVNANRTLKFMPMGSLV